MKRKFFPGKRIWVKIIGCSKDTAWYANKIGTMELVYADFFPLQYMLLYSPKPGIYPVIDKENAKEVLPSFAEKMNYYLSNINWPCWI